MRWSGFGRWKYSEHIILILDDVGGSLVLDNSLFYLPNPGRIQLRDKQRAAEG